MHRHGKRCCSCCCGQEHGNECDCGHHEGERVDDCCCERHESRHHNHHCCGEHRHHHCHSGRERGFHRRFATRAERLAEMEEYLRDLQAEVKAVEEQIADLKATR